MLTYTYPTPLPSTKGWGSGWPNCQTAKITPHPIFQGGVRDEVKELVDLIVAELQRKGYRFHEGWSWGYGCRATKGGSGEVPSFHSWGLGLDFNAPENVFGGAQLSSDLATKNKWVVAFMRKWGWFWLGPSIGDWMHFSFVGDPEDAARLTAQAKQELGKEEDMAFEDFKDGWREHETGAKIQEAWNADKKFGWRARNQAVNNPKPETLTEVPPHDHPFTDVPPHDHEATAVITVT